MVLSIWEVVLTDYTFRIVSLGSMLLGIISGVLGTFAVIRKQSLLGDAVSHSALPGIALAFLFTQTKRTEVLLLGALISGLLSTFLIVNISKYSRVKFDSALALVLSVFFGGGMVLLTYIQKIPNANQAGLEKFIFGQASTLLKRDVQIIGVLGVLLIFIVILFWKEFKLVSFDEDFAQSIGFSTEKITALLFFIIVTSIIIGLQTVGVILMSAMLTAPAVAARQWTDKLSLMVILSAFFGGVSGVVGTIFSSVISKLPTGPTIVIVISTIVLISLTLAPNRGLIWNYFRDKKNKRQINENQVLINLYNLAMNHEDIFHSHDIYIIKPVKTKDKLSQKRITDILKSLEDRGLARPDYFNKWSITEEGVNYVKSYIKGGGVE